MSLINNQETITTNYAWDMTNFAYIEMMYLPEEYLQVNPFNERSINKAWKILIYPNGKSNDQYISFFLSQADPSNKAEYNCTLSIGRPDSNPVKSYKFEKVRFLENCIGEELFLLKKHNSWLFKGPVRFQCDITEICLTNQNLTYVSSLPNHLGSHLVFPDIENLSSDLEDLLNSSFYSNLIVKINGYNIYIHKYILFTRCPNLCHEFGYPTVMDMPIYVETEVSREIFEPLMYYVYTGKLRNNKISLELFRYAESLALSSLIECIYEEALTYHICTELLLETEVISWNLDEMDLEECSTFAYILRERSDGEQLAVQVNVSDDLGNDKVIKVSFKYFRLQDGRSITLISKLSLTSQAGFEAFKKEHHVFKEDEQWDFPRLVYRKRKECHVGFEKGMCLTAELSIIDESNMRYNNYGTKNNVYTNFQTVTENLKHLRSSMNFLYEKGQSTKNLILESEDNKVFDVHDGILWARWRGVKKLSDASIVFNEDNSSHLKLELPSEVLNILLPYIYTGSIPYFNQMNAKLLLRYSRYLEFPDHLVKKCEDLLAMTI